MADEESDSVKVSFSSYFHVQVLVLRFQRSSEAISVDLRKKNNPLFTGGCCKILSLYVACQLK